MEAFYGVPPATPLPRASEQGSPESPLFVVDFDAGALRAKSQRHKSSSSVLSDKSTGSNPTSVTTACLTVTSDEEVAPARKERRKPKVSRPKPREGSEFENSQSSGMDASEADTAGSIKRRSTKPKSSRHNWMSTMGPGGGIDVVGSIGPKRTSRRGKVSDTVSLSAVSVAASVQSETSEMGGSTASGMRKKKKKPSSRAMSKHSSTLSVGSSRGSRGGGEEPAESSRMFSSASVGARPRVSTKPSRRVSSSESQSKTDDSVSKATVRAADKKSHRRLSTNGATRSKSVLVTSSKTARLPIKKSVSFDSVEVREYARILSDNPAVRKGPPLGLDWDYFVSLNLQVEEYEKKRGNRRTYAELQMPRYLRETLLQEHCDVTERELAQCMREIKKIKRQRQQSVAMQDGAQVLLEKAGRGLKRIFQKKSAKKEEDELWESAKQFAILKMQQRELQDLSADVGDEDTVL